MKKIALLILTLLCALFCFKYFNKNSTPIVAIANYGPHSSLTKVIEGIQLSLQEHGLRDGVDIKYEIVDAGFNRALLPQMIRNLIDAEPKLLITLTTPVSQVAVAMEKKLPIVFSAISDPVSAGILVDKRSANLNVTGVAERQDTSLLIRFIRDLIPSAKRIGILYSLSEKNDLFLVDSLKKDAKIAEMQLVSIGVSNSTDIPMLIQAFQDKVDVIYVGTSGLIQPALPTIALNGKKMRIPVINTDSQAVKDNLVLASFGLDYIKIGRSTGDLAFKILTKGDIASQNSILIDVPPVYPSPHDYTAYVSKQQADDFSISIRHLDKSIHIIENLINE